MDATDGYGGTTPVNEGVQSLLPLFYDSAPSAIVYLSSAAVYSLHTSSPSIALSWAPAATDYVFDAVLDKASSLRLSFSPTKRFSGPRRGGR